MLEQYVREDPNDPFNHYALAMEYYEEKPDEALSLLQELLSTHPKYLPTYFKAAHLLWDFENWDEADQVFQQGINLAKQQNDEKAEKELNAAYLNFQFDRD